MNTTGNGVNIGGGASMSLLTALSFAGNACVATIILRTPHLRAQFNHILTLSLFILGSFSALTVMPLAIASYAHAAWPLDASMCSLYAVFSTMCTSASTLTLCAISIERCYSIHAPMHYAAHMTLPRTLGTIAGIWMLSLLLSLLPLLGWNSYAFRPTRAMCSYSWTEERSFVVLLSSVTFILPGLTMVIMYSAIFKIARQTSKQVVPAVSPAPIPTVSRSVCSNGSKQGAGHSLCDSGCEMSSSTLPPEVSPDKTSPTKAQERKGHWKAAKTLLCIIAVFFSLWTPFFAVALNGGHRRTSTELVITWLGLASNAVNPMLYGWLNRAIREAFIGCCEELASKCCKRNSDLNDEAVPGENEDFFQFLERTSVTRAVSVRCSRTLIHSPTITE
jgi:hypothetical protein